MSGLAKFYETNKIKLKQVKYNHLPTTNLSDNNKRLCGFFYRVLDYIIIIIIHEFHGDTSLKQNFRAAVNVMY